MSKKWSRSVVWLFATPWTVAYQTPQSMEFSRQEYWSGLPFPSPGDLPNPGIEPDLPHCRQTHYRLSHQGSALYPRTRCKYKRWLTPLIRSRSTIKISSRNKVYNEKSSFNKIKKDQVKYPLESDMQINIGALRTPGKPNSAKVRAGPEETSQNMQRKGKKEFRHGEMSVGILSRWNGMFGDQNRERERLYYFRMAWILKIKKEERKDTAGEVEWDLPWCARWGQRAKHCRIFKQIKDWTQFCTVLKLGEKKKS